MQQPWTIRRVLQWTTSDLATHGAASPRLDAELLLAQALSLTRLQLFLDPDKPLNEEERASYRELIRRRRNREPIAYIVGQREFWSLTFEVTRNVLVPRPETEILVEEALSFLSTMVRPVVVDVGTGSGCVAAALAKERPDLRLIAMDVSREAATLAQKNLSSLDLSTHVAVVVADGLSALRSGVDMVVSNPPYIPSAEIEDLEPEVSRWEPRGALDGGPDGLVAYRALIAQARKVLRPGGCFLVEVGHTKQAEQVRELMVGGGLEALRVREDYGGQSRVVIGATSSVAAAKARGYNGPQ